MEGVLDSGRLVGAGGRDATLSPGEAEESFRLPPRSDKRLPCPPDPDTFRADVIPDKKPPVYIACQSMTPRDKGVSRAYLDGKDVRRNALGRV